MYKNPFDFPVETYGKLAFRVGLQTELMTENRH